MNIASAASFLINQAVKSAAGLKQQTRDSGNRADIKPMRDKTASRMTPNSPHGPQSSAYRVTISHAAQQRMANARNAV